MDGKPLWALANLCRHDFKILGNGTIVPVDVARRSFDRMRKQYEIRRFREGVLDSRVDFISPEGEILRSPLPLLNE